MTLKTHSCVSVYCDDCGEALGQDVTMHFTDVNEAASQVEDWDNEWFLDTASGTAYCPLHAIDHRVPDEDDIEYSIEFEHFKCLRYDRGDERPEAMLHSAECHIVLRREAVTA